MLRSREKLIKKMIEYSMKEMMSGEIKLEDFTSLCNQLEKDASADRAHSSSQAARAARDKQQRLEQRRMRTSEAAHRETSAAAHSSIENATGAAPMVAAPLRDAPMMAALMIAKTDQTWLTLRTRQRERSRRPPRYMQRRRRQQQDPRICWFVQ